MYDFNYLSFQQIKKKPENFLIFVKRLLPRWVNGIPDTECIAIFKFLEKLRKLKRKKVILLETGSGASTLAMFLHCALYGGKVFTWDTNGSKGSFLRGVINETICRQLKVDVNKIWNFIPMNSSDRNIGLGVLKEMKLKGDFCFFDSWHTLQHVMEELKEFEKVAADIFILAFDDAYYTKKNYNYSYINMVREKLKLKKIKEPRNNTCKPFYLEIGSYLKKNYKEVKLLENFYKKNYKKDIFFKYFSSDRIYLNSVGMEEKSKLSNRLEGFLVKK